ncbi:ATP-binding cassette domain-containing protein, partial [Escherichia sp. TWPC-MK]
QTLLKNMDQTDFEAIEEALEMMGIENLANRSVDELSGGQRQRVWIAMALETKSQTVIPSGTTGD